MTEEDEERYGLNSLVVPAGDGAVTVSQADIDRLGLNTPTATVEGIVITAKVGQDT